MVDFEKAHGAEAARNNERSPQRGTVTGNVQVRRHGPEETPQPRRYPREGELQDDTDTDDDGSDDASDDGQSMWADPDPSEMFDERHLPNDLQQ